MCTIILLFWESLFLFFFTVGQTQKVSSIFFASTIQYNEERITEQKVR